MIILRKLYSAESDERFVNGGGFADALNLMKKKLRKVNKKGKKKIMDSLVKGHMKANKIIKPLDDWAEKGLKTYYTKEGLKKKGIETVKKVKNGADYVKNTHPIDMADDLGNYISSSPIAALGTAAGYGTMAAGLYIPATTLASVLLENTAEKHIPGYSKIKDKMSKFYKNHLSKGLVRPVAENVYNAAKILSPV